MEAGRQLPDLQQCSLHGKCLGLAAVCMLECCVNACLNIVMLFDEYPVAPVPDPQAVDSSGRYIAVGGEGCHVQVWSLETQKAVFKAKGGKPNT